MQRYLLVWPQRYDDGPHPISEPTASYARATWPRRGFEIEDPTRSRNRIDQDRYHFPLLFPLSTPENLTPDQNYP